MKRKLYFAYGANTNMDSMAYRCPAAKAEGSMRLFNHKLVFRGVADVVPHEGSDVVGALWWITEECEESLDRFEGYPRMYVKRYVPVELNGQTHEVMFYVMRKCHGTDYPSEGYEKTLRDGYKDFFLPQKQIDTAIQQVEAIA